MSLRLAAKSRASRAPRARLDREERKMVAVTLVPALLVTFGVILIPLLEALWISLHRYNLLIPGRPFIGFSNYASALSDPGFWQATWRTVYFTAVSTGFELALGLLIALLLNQRFAGRGILRALLLLPWALPTIVNGMIWRWIYNADYGALNALLQQLGFIKDYQSWLNTPMGAMNAIIVADVWKMTPLVVMILLANLQTIPGELYEAASIDGAGALGRFRFVTLPHIRAGILVSLVARTIEAFKVFDIIFIMTRSGPANGTQTLAYYAYTETFTNLQFGKGAALSYLIAILITVLALIYFRLIREEAGVS